MTRDEDGCDASRWVPAGAGPDALRVAGRLLE